MKNIISIPLFMLVSAFVFRANAQYANFPKQGTINFEKRVNVLALLKEQSSGNDNDFWIQQITDAYEKSGKQFTATQFTLAFDGDKTLYQPVNQDPVNSWSDPTSFANLNKIYSDFDTHQSVSFKSIYGDNCLITDSTRKIRWKITDEIRDIAGFRCRRANAVIMDSVYVVAFYTDQIPTTGGPESFNGLPGMILQVALPHDHVSWLATSITAGAPQTPIVPPTKGKSYDNKTFFDKLQSAMKDWGKQGRIILQNILL